MFKTGLLTSTVITAIALVLSGAPQEAYAQTDMHFAIQDANTRFLCTYGNFLVSASSGGSSSYVESHWQHVAVPFKGQGQTVRGIRVIEARGASTYSSAVTIGIYSSGPKGLPGNVIASGIGTTGKTCESVEVSIPPTKLESGTKYWIEETVRGSWEMPTNLDWQANPQTKHRAYVQYHTQYVSSEGGHHSSNYTSPWEKQSMGPYFKLKLK